MFLVLPLLLSILTDAQKELDRMQEQSILYDTANSYNQDGSYSLSLKNWEDLICIEPNNSIYHEKYGIALFNLKKNKEAVEEFEKSISIKDNAPSHDYLGRIYYKDEKWLIAQKEFDKAIVLEPEVPLYYIHKAIALNRLGRTVTHRYEEAKDVINEYMELLRSSENSVSENWAHAYYELGIAEDGLDNTDESYWCFEKVKSYNDNYKDANYWLALESAKKEEKNNPHDAYVLNQLGNRYWDLKKYSEAKEVYLKAVSIDPNFSTCYSNLAGAEYKLGNFDEAMEIFDKAIDLNENNEIAKNKKRIYTLEKAVDDDPNNVEIAIKLGRTYIEAGWFYEAKEMFSKLREKDPADGLYSKYLELLSSHEETSNNPSDYSRRFEYASKLYNLEFYDISEKELWDLIQNNSESERELGRYYNELGCIYHEREKKSKDTEDIKKAKEFFEEASKLVPDEKIYSDNLEIENSRLLEKGY